MMGLDRLRYYRRLPSKDILKEAQEVDNVRTLIYSPIAQVGVVDSSINTNVLARPYGHTFSRYHKDHDALRVCRIGMWKPYCHRESIDCAAKVDGERA